MAARLEQFLTIKDMADPFAWPNLVCEVRFLFTGLNVGGDGCGMRACAVPRKDYFVGGLTPVERLLRNLKRRPPD